MKLIFATGNKGKLREAADILGEGFELLCPADFGITEDIPETGSTLEENSIQKAEYIYARTGMDCFADDTGLEVDCLDGAPGVYTARYAGPGCNFGDNMDKLLREMAKKGPSAPRTARFRTVVTLIKDGKRQIFEGVVEGRIATEKCGREGFGYDPVFLPDFPAGSEHAGKTFAEIPEHDKNAISHRGRSLRKMAAWLRGE
ncbi:MAG: RdgB/HAM1 family non-canonical purine NTP pyrophosphatase [Bacteroidales bacterium]|nr:RdgB/HAM1 family non-canonical purine NTP pyrophosphatase [Bacteroidales bacterium]